MIIPGIRPLLPAVFVIALATLGCAAGPAASAWAAPGGCSFTYSPGHLKGDGGESRVIMNNGTANMGCGRGPTISLTRVDGNVVSFALGDQVVRVAAGSTAALGPYQVRVTSVRGQTVQLELTS